MPIKSRYTGSVYKRIFVIPDTHVPFHDKLAWRTALLAAKAAKPDIVVIIGDFADCYTISHYTKNPARKTLLHSEISAVNRELDRVSEIGADEVVFVVGNHEDRLERFLCEKAPELYGLVDIKSLLKIEERGWKFVPYRDSIQYGKIIFTHDVGRSGANSISQSLNDMGHSIVFGHAHRLGSVYQGTVDGSRRVGVCVGWLGSIEEIDYRHKLRAEREWQHGFGLVDMTRDGLGFCQAIPIIKGRTMIDGVIINGNR